MQYQKKTLNLLNKSSGFKFVIRNWNSINDQLNASYSVGNEIAGSAEVLKSILTF